MLSLLSHIFHCRFIHDIVVATLKSTGFPNGLFSLDELNSSNFKDSKAAKVAFLNKLIHLVNVGSGSALTVSPSKIVSGLEPLNTNILLGEVLSIYDFDCLFLGP